MTHVFKQAVNGPATHVLVIGVGAYAHLIGGTGPLLKDEHGSLGQLSSPPISARKIADWFVDHHRHPDKPLASLRLLLSEPQASPYRGHVVDVASIALIEKEILAWKAAGDQNAENLLLFYFCGHGLGSGSDMALLASDFGENPNNPMDGALDLRRLALGMLGRCEAKHVVYFVDACRMSNELTDEGDFWGRVPVGPKKPKSGRQGPIFNSTLLGDKAYSKRDQPSYFTQALLHGLDGAGADNSEGDWRVSTTQLKRAIDGFIQRRVEAGTMSLQIAPASNLTSFDLHYLPGEPLVPVFVECRPDAANGLARFACKTNGVLLHERAPDSSRWELVLGVGTYSFEASFEQVAPNYRKAVEPSVMIHPPHKVVPLKVQP